MKISDGGVCAAKGFSANGVHCGIRKNKIKKDLSLIVHHQCGVRRADYRNEEPP